MRRFLRHSSLYLFLALSPTVVWGERPGVGDDGPVRAKRPLIRSQNVAIVGFVDIDGDGRSDRKLIHDLLQTSNSRIDEEIDEQGKRTGPGMTAQTHYLLVFDVPDPKKLEGKEREAAIRVAKDVEEMIAKARELGVRRVRMRDFLRYGSPRKGGDYTLRAGPAMNGRPPVNHDRSSSGQVSRRFTNRRGLRFERGKQDCE